MSMRLISVNVSPPLDVIYGDTTVSTGIFKQPVQGAVAVRRLNLDGDGQADLINHGGESKAVYAYSLDHYDYWREALGRTDLEYGQFGENLTVAGLDESQLCIGDQLRIGDAFFTISQPRVPCFKLGIRFADKRLPKMFAHSLRTGFYLRVAKEGSIAAGDAVEVVGRGAGGLSVRSLFDAYLKPNDREALRLLARAIEIPQLSPEWRGHIGERLARRPDPGRA
jgi:MOSC domain-containing protein YiiM